MCGIAGLYRFGPSATADDAAAVGRMTQAQLHRGPDGAGQWSEGPVVLGHRRLSIIDISENARQPMGNESGRIQVVFNGEIYNHPSLRSELMQAGHQFQSQSDTEVLVHGYEQWGIEGLLSRLRGMFAFGLVDASNPQAPRLLLARDRFGIKPLYYAFDKDKLVFASEVRALLRSGLVPYRPSREAWARFLQWGSVPAPHTTFESVACLPPAHYLVVGQGRLTPKRYWEMPVTVSDPREAVEGTALRLKEAIQGHLLSDVPLGIFLSGGIDSSALVALAARERSQPLTTLSVIFDESEFSEAAPARAVAKKYGAHHQEVRVQRGDFMTQWARILQAMDQPSIDGVNSFFISQATKQAGLKVVLSGLGGDEVFLGYPHLRFARRWSVITTFLRALPPWAAKPASRALGTAGGRAGFPGLERAAYVESQLGALPYLLVRGLCPPARLQALMGLSSRELDALMNLTESTHVSTVDDMTEMEFTHYLPNQLLRDTDAMSMAHSIEVRVPFLDHSVVEFVRGLPEKIRRGGSRPKGLLLDAVGRDELPPAVWDRPKQGFTFPLADWLRQESPTLEEQACQNRELDTKAVRALWSDFRAGRAHWSQPWATVVMSALARRPTESLVKAGTL